mmetsp:Transcript_17310/g.44329  ORF Transcript_17310/g.44329 Transcript_17310/m.44329 type:complete len:286 (+) Transcript_17310:87-944(+)
MDLGSMVGPGWGLDLALQEASDSGNVSEVLAQLEAGADVNGKALGPFCDSPLTCASEKGHLACARVLLAAGADLDQSLDGHSTALFNAAFSGHVHVVSCLLEAGASQDAGGDLYSGEYQRGSSCHAAIQLLQLLRAYDPARNVVLGPRLRAVPGCQAFLDVTRRWTSQLHYHQFLPAERVARLLAGGADVHARDDSADAPSPIGLARAFLRTGATDVCAGLVVSADPIPWSEGTHASSSRRGGARAVELLLAGHLLVRRCQGSTGKGTALLDVWVAHVMPHALHR